MNININVDRKYRINGREYGSLEEMPPEVREIFEKAIALKSGDGSRSNQIDFNARITFNDREYESVDAMPESVRSLYETVMKAAESGKVTPEVIQKALGATGNRSSFQEPRRNTIRVEATFSPGKLAVSLLVFAALVFLWYLFFGSGAR